jgi:hypothetical protein
LSVFAVLSAGSAEGPAKNPENAGYPISRF